MPSDLTSNSRLVEEIRSGGKFLPGAWTERDPYDVAGLTFLLGGRNSIASILNKSPAGSFTGNKLIVRIGTEFTALKRYTIIAIFSAYNSHFVDKNKEFWPTLLVSNQDYGSITFKSIAEKLASDDAKVMNAVVNNVMGK
ncbi:MAG: hypothetical protein J5I65_17865 [Aridibacter famidurans]|nr:hypothetical protein [Aridibacter famidurans]